MTNIKMRMYGLDVLRACLALLVFMFHSRIHMGCSYGWLNLFVNMGAIAMTGFFLLSGFVLYSTSCQLNPTSIVDLAKFYKKRLIAIYPTFLFVSIVAIFWSILSNPSIQHCVKHIVQLPVLLLGISTVFTSLFKFPPNGGFWFVSCLFFCYALFPWFSSLTTKMGKRGCSLICGLSAFVLLYSPLVVKVHGLASIYSNPFFRLLEFLIGVTLARLSICENLDRVRRQAFIALDIALLVVGVSLLNKFGIATANYMLYSWVALPCFGGLIVLLGSNMPFHMRGGGVIVYISNLSYAFFLGQFFCFRIVKIAMRQFPSLAGNNVMKMSVSFLVCLAISVLLYEFVQKPCRRWLMKLQK